MYLDRDRSYVKVVKSAFMRKICLVLSLLLFSLSSFSQSRTISTSTKKVVFARDGGKCRCCGSSLKLEYDHIKPFSCGGSNEHVNIQLLCQKCNRSKSNSCYCKIHNRKVGVDCCDSAATVVRPTTQSAPRTSSGVSQQCTGTTQKGARCRNRTTRSSGRCHLH